MQQKSNQPTTEEVDSLKFRIKDLFSGYGVWNLSDKISHISQYYAYLSDALNYQRVAIDADPELIQRFESVFLWLQDRLGSGLITKR